MTSQQSFFLLAFACYLLAMVVISWWVSRWQKSASDFLLAGRRVPVFLTLGTTVATMVGTGSSMGAVGFAYQNGWAGTLYGIGGALGILLLAWLFAPARAQNFSTMSEELASYVDNHPFVKKLLALLIYSASIGWLGAHLIGGGMYLSWLTGIEQGQAKLIIGIGLAVYVTIGGYSAVVWTDAIQAVMLFIGFVFMAYFALDLVGGLGAIQHSESVVGSGLLSINTIGVIPAISLAIAVLVGVLATPSFRQRIYSAESVRSVRQSFVISGGLYLLFSGVPALIGISAYLLNAQLDNPAFAFPYLALHSLPLLFGGLLILAGLSATLSSASSDAIAGVSVLVDDIYQWLVGSNMPEQHQLLISRVAMLLTVGLALFMALLSDDIVSYITHMVAMVMSGLCVMGLLGRFWRGYTWQGALTTLISGVVGAGVVAQQASWLAWFGNPVLPALCSAMIFGILASKLSQKSSVNKAHNTVEQTSS
ncbi:MULTISPECIES: sodium:solute symporter family protein [Pseudoalteromonas]|uniref:Sodium:proline symporter n=1 Tax=Pseudoalteromonas amylolytica TaxID=1859457 RepID=A0A1S1MZ89_9GAMM|nr:MULTISPECIES: sodium:solute symporter family protein [Pseudoalteromonas]OHU87664.1 sodium:proline symporter [Pseudoalteromonas sp. JW3]OHU91106.1 sodium:proline symporter [Pseudoalteromonas amylolytica]